MARKILPTKQTKKADKKRTKRIDKANDKATAVFDAETQKELAKYQKQIKARKIAAYARKHNITIAQATIKFM